MRKITLLLSLLFAVGCSSIQTRTMSVFKSKIDTDNLHKILDVAKKDVDHCIKKAFKYRSFKAAGTMKLTWYVNNQGLAKDIYVEQSLDGIFDTCMMDVVTALDYRPSESSKEIKVNFPFYYSGQNYQLLLPKVNPQENKAAKATGGKKGGKPIYSAKHKRNYVDSDLLQEVLKNEEDLDKDLLNSAETQISNSKGRNTASDVGDDLDEEIYGDEF